MARAFDWQAAWMFVGVREYKPHKYTYKNQILMLFLSKWVLARCFLLAWLDLAFERSTKSTMFECKERKQKIQKQQMFQWLDKWDDAFLASKLRMHK